MKVLWQQLPLSDTAKYLVDGPPAEGTIALIQHIGGFRVAPLVSPQLALVAELTITFLRPEEPGSLIYPRGGHRQSFKNTSRRASDAESHK